jgi:hypothetical protein
VLEANEYYGLLALIAALITAFVLFMVPALRLLARTVYRHRPLSYPRTVLKVCRFLTYGIGRKRIYEAACRWIETELLNPRPQPPDRFEFDGKSKYRAARREHRVAHRKWRRQAWRGLAALMNEARRDSAMITVPTCFELYRAETEIRRYFAARDHDRTVIDPEPGVFWSRIRVVEGFLAPLYLLGGLLSHFEDDWKPVIDDYGKTMATAHGSIEPDVQALQSFLFSCWLLWGPSIPIGTCTQWRGKRLFQFGYGDENNSIALLAKGNSAELAPLLGGNQRTGFPTLASRAQVTGLLTWVPSIDKQQFCSAQQPELSYGQAQLILRATEPVDEPGGLPAEVARRYYSAYIWVIFVLCDRDGKPLYRKRWRNMLPFFEHGNIAEKYTYEALKKQLAVKALSSIELVLKAEPDLTVRYACAIDDCGCGHPLQCPPPRLKSIREMLMGNRNSFADLAASGRVTLAAPTGAKDAYAACQLPVVLNDYMKSVNGRAATR